MRPRRMPPGAAMLAATLMLAACAGPPVATDVALRPNPNPRAPLAGILSFTADRPVVPSITIDDGEHRETVTPDPEPRERHELPVLGLRPGTKHTVEVTIRDERGRETTLEPLSIETPPLPDDFPPIAVNVRRPAAMEPGPTMISVFRWAGTGQDDPDWGVTFAVDAEGVVRWLYTTDFVVGEARRLRNGNLLLAGGRFARVLEVDMLGNVVREWHGRYTLDPAEPGSIEVATDTFHHDVIELPSGNFLALGLEVRAVDDFPLEYPPGKKRGAANLAGDELVEFRPDGEVVRRVKVLDRLDPERLGYGSLGNEFYREIYEKRVEPLPIDTVHSNAIYYLEDQDAVVVSTNFQCVLYKVALGTGELEWLLGDPTGWREGWSQKLLQPKGDLVWPCHQHGLERTPRGTWLLYDNGGSRSFPPDPGLTGDAAYSRVVEYRVDEAARTVEQVWTYGPDEEWFMSPFISDADHLPDTGNVLVTDGGRIQGADGKPMTNFGGRHWARIFEVSYADKEKVWELVVDDPATSYSVYRSQRLRSLYPKLDRPTG